MVLTVTEDTPADMLAGSMELLVQLPRDHSGVHAQRVTVPRSTPMMDLLVQIATAHKLSASSYTLQAIGERGLVLPHQPNTPIGALDALQVKLSPKQGTFLPRKAKQANQPFETTFRLQVLLPRNQLYVSRVSPKMNLGKILEEVCKEKNLDADKYELRHPANLEETLDLSLSLQDYHLQEVTLYAKQGRTLGAALSSQDIMALQRQEERRRQRAKQSIFGFMFRKSKDSSSRSLSIDSLGGRSASPARSDETCRSVSPLAPPSRPQRKRRPAPKPPLTRTSISGEDEDERAKERLVASHSRNSSDSSGYHEASVLSDNPDSNGRMPETLPRRGKPPSKIETSRGLAQTSEASKSLGNLAMASGGLSHGISSTSISSTGTRKKRAAPPPPMAKPLTSAISSQALERIIDSEESLTSDIDISKSPSDIAASSKANSDIGVHSMGSKPSSEIGYKIEAEFRAALADHEDDAAADDNAPDADVASSLHDEREDTNETPLDTPRIAKRDARAWPPTPKPRSVASACETSLVVAAPRLTLKRPGASETKIVESEDVPKDEERRGNSGDAAREGQRQKPRRTEMNLSIGELKRVKSVDDICALSRELFTEEASSRKDPPPRVDSGCAIISTIPKCSRLTADRKSEQIEKSAVQEAANRPVVAERAERPVTKRRKQIFRSQSSLEEFGGVDSFEKRQRHSSTVETKDLKCALNPNFPGSIANLAALEINTVEGSASVGGVGKSARVEMDTVEESAEVGGVNKSPKVEKKSVESWPIIPPAVVDLERREDREVGDENEDDSWAPQLMDHSGSEERPTETDILLQRVSDTLSSSLPTEATPSVTKIAQVPSSERIPSGNVVSESKSRVETRKDDALAPLTVCRPDATLNSQQDTSDYVSAIGDDLSIADWEYQLPAPPSAFRDSASPVFDGYDTITLRSVEAFEEPATGKAPEVERTPVSSSLPPSDPPEDPHPRVTTNLRREMIGELSSKLENGSFPGGTEKKPEKDARSAGTIERSEPKIAPVDNTLSNFTITTYSRKKTLNIFEDPVDDRRSTLERTEDDISETKSGASAVSENESSHRLPVPEKTIYVQRSKSHVTVANNSKYRQAATRRETNDDAGIVKSTSVTNLNEDDSQSIEKFSQWRENVSRTWQRKPLEDKELRSIQVLKNILPRLRSTRATEESVGDSIDGGSKTSSKVDSSADSGGPSERPMENVAETKREESRRDETSARSYRYAGPPTISLGSWSERPRASVQLKMDADYILATSNKDDGGVKVVQGREDSAKVATSRGGSKEASVASRSRATSTSEKSSPGTRISFVKEEKKDFRREERSFPVEGKLTRERLADDDVKIDTKPVDFRQLSKTFGQEVRLRSKPRRLPLQNRHSDCPDGGASDATVNRPANNGVHRISSVNHITSKRYASIVGIDSLDVNVNYNNNNINNTNKSVDNGSEVFAKNSPVDGRMFSTMTPVVKGFKISREPRPGDKFVEDSARMSNVPPPPPPPPTTTTTTTTMPIITGVTLKNTIKVRPKSMLIGDVDPRDQLLESIRSFGGRDRLKSSRSPK